MWQGVLVFSVLLLECSGKFMSQTGKVIRQSTPPSAETMATHFIGQILPLSSQDFPISRRALKGAVDGDAWGRRPLRSRQSCRA